MKYKKKHNRKTKKRRAFLWDILVVEVALAASRDALAAFGEWRLDVGQPAKGYQNTKSVMQCHSPDVTKDNRTPKGHLKCFGFNGAETNCGIAHILGILPMNSYNTNIFFSNYYNLQSVHFELHYLETNQQQTLPNSKTSVITWANNCM